MTTISIAGRLAVVCLLVVATVAVPGAAGDDIHAIDTNHDLASEAAIQTYEDEEQVSGQAGTLNMTLTVAEDAGDVGLDEWSTVSSGRTFLRIEYHEEIERMVRIYIPREYFLPRFKEDRPAKDGDLTASFDPTEDRNHTAVTIRLAGPTDAVFAVPTSRGMVPEGRDRVRDIVNDTVGIQLPTLGSGADDWQYVSPSALRGDNVTYPIHHTNGTEHTIQYDAAQSEEEPRWVTVRACNANPDEPVCKLQKEGQTNTTYLLSDRSEPPQVRYKDDATRSDGVSSSINDLRTAVDRMLEDAKGWLPGDDGGGGGE